MIRLGSLQIRAVLFDLDGTLVHTQIDFDRMYREVRAAAQSAGVPEAVIEGRHVLEAVDAAAAWVGGSPGLELRRSMWDALESIEVDGCASPSLIAGADALFAELRAASVGIGVVTRNCRSVSQRLLDRFGLIANILLSRDDVEKTKPNPQHLLDALGRLDAPAHDSVMVGDHWLDVLAGQEAGCGATIGLRGERSPSWFETDPPTYIVRNLTEAIGLFAPE